MSFPLLRLRISYETNNFLPLVWVQEQAISTLQFFSCCLITLHFTQRKITHHLSIQPLATPYHATPPPCVITRIITNIILHCHLSFACSIDVMIREKMGITSLLRQMYHAVYNWAYKSTRAHKTSLTQTYANTPPTRCPHESHHLWRANIKRVQQGTK